MAQPASAVNEHPHLGLKILKLADRRYSANWIRRRVEVIRLHNERTLDKRISFFIDLSKVSPADRPIWREDTLILPLHRLSRKSHLVTVVEAPGIGELMRPTQLQERAFVYEGLSAMWNSARVGSDILKHVKPLLNEPIDDRALMSRHHALDAQTRLFEAVLPAHGLLCGKHFGDFLTETRRWQENYLLLVEIPVGSLHDDCAIITMSYTEHIPVAHVLSSGTVNIRTALSLFRKLVGGSLSRAVVLPVRAGTGTAESSHFLLEAPQGFRVVDARLRFELRRRPQPRGWFRGRLYELSRIQRPLLTSNSIAWSIRNMIMSPVRHFMRLPHRTVMVSRDDDRLPEVAHVHVARSSIPVDNAFFIVNIYAYRSGFFTESLLASWILFGISAIFYFHLRPIHFTIANGHSKYVNANIAGALILLLPAAIVTMVTQRDTHRIASRCFALPRLLLAISALGSVGGAAMLGLDVQGHKAEIWWSVIYWVALVVAGRITLGALVHLYRVSRLREWAYRKAWARFDREARRNLEEPSNAVRVGADTPYTSPRCSPAGLEDDRARRKRWPRSRVNVSRPRETSSWRSFPTVPDVEEQVEDRDYLLVEFDRWLSEREVRPVKAGLPEATEKPERHLSCAACRLDDEEPAGSS